MLTPTSYRELHGLAWTSSDTSSSEASSPDSNHDCTFNVAYNDITNQPITVLLELLEHIRRFNYTIFDVTYKAQYEGARKLEKSEGQDDMGLGRDLITSLCMKLFSKYQDPNFMYIENGFPGFRKGYDDSKAFLALGVIMGLCLDEDKRYVTGPLFNEKTYELIYKHLKCLDVNRWRILAYKELTRFSELPEDVYNQTILELSGLQPIENSTGPIDYNSLILKLAKKHPYLQAIESLSSGFSESAVKIFIDTSVLTETYNSDDLKYIIEGVTDSKDIISSLTYEFEDCNDSVDIESISQWLINWINQAERADLERFLWAITGSRTLNAHNREICIILSGSMTSEHLPYAKTCYSSLYFPASYPDEETFKQKLEMFLTESLNEVDRFQDK